MGASNANEPPENMPRTLEWIGDAAGFLRILDQTRLPAECVYLDCTTMDAVWNAIRRLSVRGAPAIGVAAGYAVVLGLQSVRTADRQRFDERLRECIDDLATSRPTAVNLFKSLERMRAAAMAEPTRPPHEMLDRLLAEARAIEREDRQMCAAIGRVGAALLNNGDGVLTHCNAGALATAGDGTALSIIYAACSDGKQIHVYADETRPLLQGARLTAWELAQRGVPVTLICDSAAGRVMQQGRVRAVITGADRIAANGDTANKVGTYPLALLARAHAIPFYVAAPSSTFDLSLPSGDAIPIEERAAAEVVGNASAPAGVDVYNPAFDVTPAQLITAIVTDRGLITPVNADNIRKVLGR